jgi:hypothetical protein
MPAESHIPVMPICPCWVNSFPDDFTEKMVINVILAQEHRLKNKNSPSEEYWKRRKKQAAVS